MHLWFPTKSVYRILTYAKGFGIMHEKYLNLKIAAYIDRSLAHSC